MLLICFGCEEEERTTLNRYEKKLLDSVYTRDVSYVRKSADSLCKANSKLYFEYYVDSLKLAYIEGIYDIQEYLNVKE